jgi:uncharacterized protein YacL (UPF0231 family)
MSNAETETAPYEVGFKKVPRHSQYQKGQSGNPQGRTKGSPPASLTEAFARALHKRHKVGGLGKRQRRSPKEVMARQLVEDAGTGDRQALITLIGLLDEHGKNSALGIEWRSQSFRDALKGKSWDKLTDEFFEKQDQEKAAWRKELRETAPLGLLLKRELARKVIATRNGKQVKMPMRDIIVSRFLNQAINGDKATVKLLLNIVPEKTFLRRVRVHVERPTPIEQEWLNEEFEKEKERIDTVKQELNCSPEKKAWLIAQSHRYYLHRR